MSCCREHEMYLNWKPDYNVETLQYSLMELFGWTYLQAKIVVENTKQKSKCLLTRANDDQVSELTVKMAQLGLAFTVSKIDIVK